MTGRHECAGPAPSIDGACWTTIGVHGNRSCSSLEQYVHCRNCPVYSEAGSALLDGELSAEALADYTRHFATSKVIDEGKTESAIVFRIGGEWLALPTSVVAEVAESRPVHTVPHRRGGIVLGLANVRGELVVCVSLARLLGLDQATGSTGDSMRMTSRRFLVMQGSDARALVPVDEVSGIHRYAPRDLKAVPATVAKASSAYSKAVLIWSGHSVGLLDDQRLLRSMKGSLS